MDLRSAYLLQVLEKLGAPLMAAVGDVFSRTGAAVPGKAYEAEKMAELLARSVQSGLALSASLELRDSGAQGGAGDSIRLALTALSSGLVAGHYRHTAKVPDDSEIKRLVGALETVMTFADNFTPAAESALRLEMLKEGATGGDESQISLQYLSALVPVINVVTDFSFGRPEKKLAQEIAERLVSRASSLRGAILPALTPGTAEARRAELQLLRGLAQLYVECHRTETKRLTGLSEQARAPAGNLLSLDPVWEAFEARTTLIEALGQNIVPQTRIVAQSQSSSGISIQKQSDRSDSPPPPPAPPVDNSVNGPYNPMAFFKSGVKNSKNETDSNQT